MPRADGAESSWSSGGASAAELAAMSAFAQDPTLKVVEACSVKQYGRNHEGPIIRYRPKY
jgi:hypothetical protein